MTKHIRNTSEEALFEFDYEIEVSEKQFYLSDILTASNDSIAILKRLLHRRAGYNNHAEY